MKERPILFSAEMVRAVLDGRKTQTRRVVKPQPPAGYNRVSEYVFDPTLSARFENDGSPLGMWTKRSPYGQPGDRLWVRERFGAYRNGHPTTIKDATYAVLADGSQMWADGTYFPFSDTPKPQAMEHIVWRPSIFMPRWASRITLEVTEVRVERVQEITWREVLTEGVMPCGENYAATKGGTEQLIADFGSLWNKINGKRPGCSWGDNPWIWCVGFKRI